MFRVYKLRGVVRIDPSELDKGLETAALSELKKKFEGMYSRDLGLIIALRNLKVSPEGYIVMGDGATYHEVEFEVLAYVPMINEVIEATVENVAKHGAHIRVGPIDGLIHISQIADEEAFFDPVRGAIVLRQSKRVLMKGDKVRARVTSVSGASAQRLPRMSLTMRQPYLGKIEWIKEYKAKSGGK
ncbi:MAG: DNA-directed RNA polymerase [Crenarchaeota archaeon]|nr:DNA-directed RNA polymerase [Thermoproteota archaeon]